MWIAAGHGCVQPEAKKNRPKTTPPKSPKSHNMTQMRSLQRLSRYKQDEMKEGFLLALRHHMELNHSSYVLGSFGLQSSVSFRWQLPT